jgi:hypothetical protein
MKISKRKLKHFIYLLIVVFIVVFIHGFTYSFDKTLVENDSQPILCVNIGGVKDNGTRVYYGFGYQIVEWNLKSTQIIDGQEVSGISYGYEVHKFPYFVDWKDGTSVKLKFMPYE